MAASSHEQRVMLRKMQQGISDELFINGSAMGIISAKDIQYTGTFFNLEKFGALDKLYVPTLDIIKDDNDREHERLSLAVVHSLGEHFNQYMYYPLGLLDPSGVIVHPYMNVPVDPAELVMAAAHHYNEPETRVCCPT